MPVVPDFIHHVAQQPTLAECWAELTRHLATFGFDRVMYGCKDDVKLGSINNFADSVILSTYGEELDETFLRNRMFVHSPTVKWALRNEGAISWGHSEERYRRGKLSKAETRVFEMTRAAGLQAGYTYSLPFRQDGYRACFGLAFRAGGTQEDADASWTRNEREITQLLSIFEIAVRRYRHVPPNQALGGATLSILKLAAQGRTVTEIAELQGNHRRTIEDHLTRARTQLGAANTLQAVWIARQQGQI